MIAKIPKELEDKIEPGWKRVMSRFFIDALVHREYNVGSSIDIYNSEDNSIFVMNTLGETIDFSVDSGLKIHSLIGDATLPFPSLILGEKWEWNSCWSHTCSIINEYFPKLNYKY